MVRGVFTGTSHTYWWLNTHAPTNRLARRLRAHPNLTGVLIAFSIGLACLLGAGFLGTAIQHGAPGWLNLAVLVLAWDGFKTLSLVVVLLAGMMKRGLVQVRGFRRDG